MIFLIIACKSSVMSMALVIIIEFSAVYYSIVKATEGSVQYSPIYDLKVCTHAYHILMYVIVYWHAKLLETGIKRC